MEGGGSKSVTYYLTGPKVSNYFVYLEKENLFWILSPSTPDKTEDTITAMNTNTYIMIMIKV